MIAAISNNMTGPRWLTRRALCAASLVVYISQKMAGEEEHQGDEPDAAQERQALHDHNTEDRDVHVNAG